MPTTYLIVRHGEVKGNRELRFIGQADVPLSDLGARQAATLCERLARFPITAIMSSDLRRAVDTVTPLSERLGVPVRPDGRLREIFNGEWDGLLPADIEERWPELWRRYSTGEDVSRPGGERWADVQARVVAALEEDSAGRSDGDHVVLSTHSGPALGIMFWALGIELKNVYGGPIGPVYNGSLTTLEMPSRRLMGVNDVGHLGELHAATAPFMDR